MCRSSSTGRLRLSSAKSATSSSRRSRPRSAPAPSAASLVARGEVGGQAMRLPSAGSPSKPSTARRQVGNAAAGRAREACRRALVARRAGRGRPFRRRRRPRRPRPRRRSARAARGPHRSRPGSPTPTSSSCTRAAKGAGSTVSIFIDSRTSTGAPAATSAPTSTGVATTRAGAGDRSDAALVTRHPVRDAVDLDEVDRAVSGGDEAVGAAADGDAAPVPVDRSSRPRRPAQRADDAAAAPDAVHRRSTGRRGSGAEAPCAAP